MSILAYHMVDPRFDWGVTRVTPKQFEKHIHQALKLGVSFHTLSDYLSLGPLYQPKKKQIKKFTKIGKILFQDYLKTHVALTFDDGYESVYRYALPILKAYNIPATVFLVVGYVGQMNTWDVNLGWKRFSHLTWKQVEEMAANRWEVGSHGMYHRDLTQLPLSAVKNELEQSKRIIESRISHSPQVISYPFGNANKVVCQFSKQCGYKAGVLMGRKSGNLPENFDITRTGVYLFDTDMTIRQKILAKNKRFYHIVQNVFDFCSDGSVIVKKNAWY